MDLFALIKSRLWRPVLVAALVAALPIDHAAARELSYERLIKPRSLSERDRELLREVRRWSRKHGKGIRYDPRLSFAAVALLPGAPIHPGERIDLPTARRVAQRWGWTDGQLAAIALRVPAADTGTELGDLLTAELTAELKDLDVNRVGLATAREEESVVLVALFSRHLVNLVPFAARLEEPRAITLGGTLSGDIPAAKLELVVGRADGGTTKIPLDLRGRRFAGELIVTDRDQGEVLHAQVLIDRGRGPEIAASFAVGVGAAPWLDPITSSGFPELEGEWQREGDPTAQLTGLILGLRASQDLPLPTHSTLLTDVARNHALDMRDHAFFAHNSPTSGDVTDRLRHRGILFARALENIATAATVHDAMESWLRSPSHRANLLDPDIDTLGVAVVAGEPRSQFWAVAVLARLADDGAATELAAKTEQQINDCRARRGREVLRQDQRLRRLATRHSHEMAGSGRLSDISSTRGRLADTVFREVDVSQAATDVYVTDAIAAVIDVVASSPHLSGPYHRLGVGVFRQPGMKGPQLWVTVIYAAD